MSYRSPSDLVRIIGPGWYRTRDERMELKRIGRGWYWFRTADTEPLRVGGVVEFPTFTLAVARLAAVRGL